MPEANPSQIIILRDVSNREFLERHAWAGCVGLSGGDSLVDKAICRAERHLDEQARWGKWSHAFLFEGRRVDGQHWVIESNLQIHHKHIQLGVQENRISKYFDEKSYPQLAVLDFGLTAEQLDTVLCAGLDLAANKEQYSLRELIGTLIALKRPQRRSGENLLARERSLFCSALVQHLFRKAGVDLAPGVDDKNTTPEDIARSRAPHVTYLLQRDAARSPLAKLKARVQRRVGARLRQLKQRTR